MSLIQVINVGQGNCIVIKPPDNCRFSQKELIFDVGNGMTDISKHLSATIHKEVFLSHCHKDHVGGLYELLLQHHGVIDCIWLPFYQNEIVLIAQAILKLKGMKFISNNYKEYFEELLKFQGTLKRNHKNIDFVSHRHELCYHLQAFNPVADIMTTNSPTKENIQQVVGIFDESFQNQLLMYLNSDRNYVPDAPSLFEYMINPQEKADTNRKQQFVFRFFNDNLSLFRSFNDNPSISLLNKIKFQHDLTSHQACSVIQYKRGNISCLLPGDADISVMKRLVKNKEKIQSTYVVLPHHGSKKNINENILRYINPRVAIISHDNAKFGRSKDTHPNQEVLDMLKSNGIGIISTNDIIKNGKMIFNKYSDNKPDLNVTLA